MAGQTTDVAFHSHALVFLVFGYLRGGAVTQGKNRDRNQQ
jgi:hypothetical protein